MNHLVIELGSSSAKKHLTIVYQCACHIQITGVLQAKSLGLPVRHHELPVCATLLGQRHDHLPRPGFSVEISNGLLNPSIHQHNQRN